MVCFVLTIILIVIVNLDSVYLIDISINVKVMEETSPEIAFISLKSVLRENSMIADDFLFLNRHSLIDVKANGDMSFRERIDLEGICSSKQICCGAIQCEVKIYIPLKNKVTDILIDSITVELEILDKNDNKPQFSKDKLELTVPESVKIGFQITIESAIDHDFSSINRIHEYRLIESSKTFHLKHETSKSNFLFLQVNKLIDYEKQTNYKMTLLACDPNFCSNQSIIINIRDENDNAPKFEMSVYNITVNETFPKGQRILTLKAVDLDKSINFSTVFYYIDSKPFDSNVYSTFKLNEITGDLILNGELNSKIRIQYSFQVKAQDSIDGGNTDFATVSIQVKDQNNNPPFIDILYPSNRNIAILENQPPQQIAILTVTDNDLGINSMIACELKPTKDSGKFSLQNKSRDLFSIHSLKQFDYEKEQSCFIQIQCHDFGVPSLTTIKSLEISILDENEHSPIFIQSRYSTPVKENTPPDTPLTQITAYDEDKSAELRYSFDNQTENIYLKIDARKGWISTTENIIDREKIQQISKVIYVTDTLGKDARTASASILFQVTDENDNKPVFTERFSFKIVENAKINTIVGEVWASDADEGGSAVLQYYLLKTWSSRLTEVDSLFLMKTDGRIETKGDIDRELDDNFTLLIAVSDDNNNPRNYVTTNVTITIEDDNDNSPIWLIPNYNNSIFNVTNNFKVGDQIIQLLAKDSDTSDNGRVQYYLSPNDPENEVAAKYFLVNSTTGSILVINQLMDAKYRLCLEAADFGSSPRRTSIVLSFMVFGQISQTLKIAVVASIITVTGIISMFLIIAIICVRKHPNRATETAVELNTTDKDESYLKLKSPLNYVPQTPDFLTLIGSDNVNNTLQTSMLSPCQRHMNEYLDADSGDSGNGPSEEGISSHYINDGKVFLRSMNQPAMNYPVSPFIQSGIYPHSCFSLPENSIISQISDDMLIGNSYYDLSTSNNRNLTGLFQKIPSVVTNNGEYSMQNLYSQLSQI